MSISKINSQTLEEKETVDWAEGGSGFVVFQTYVMKGRKVRRYARQTVFADFNFSNLWMMMNNAGFRWKLVADQPGKQCSFPKKLTQPPGLVVSLTRSKTLIKQILIFVGG